MSIRRGGFGWSRCVAVRPSNSSRPVRRNCAETKRKQCGLPMSPRPAHATFWLYRLVATSRLLAGWRFSILRYSLPTKPKASPSPSQGRPASGRRASSTGVRRGCPCRRMRPAGPPQAARRHPYGRLVGPERIGARGRRERRRAAAKDPRGRRERHRGGSRRASLHPMEGGPFGGSRASEPPLY